ncbi:hypothetical protein [Treponema putidum]|nr:hypothetical protein [Treponema putidum]
MLKSFDELTIADDFMFCKITQDFVRFCKIMQDEKTCKTFLNV